MLSLFALVAMLASCATRKPEQDFEFFGVATLDAAGRICLQLRSEEPGGPVAEGYFCYEPDDPRYPSIRAHVGELKVGQAKVIQPFPPGR